MNIEKINEHKIKCTLTQKDLEERDIHLEELAYGTDKAHILFEEMLGQAYERFGFEYQDTPISVEAIPVSADHIVLIISQMTGFDELDTRFSRFSEADSDAEEREAAGSDMLEAADTLVSPEKKPEKEAAPEVKAVNDNPVRIYTFRDLDTIIEVSHVLHGSYNGVNSLYKDRRGGLYYLLLWRGFHTSEEFGRTCNILSEYGLKLKNAETRAGYCEEHYDCIVKKTALQRLYLF